MANDCAVTQILALLSLRKSILYVKRRRVIRHLVEVTVKPFNMLYTKSTAFRQETAPSMSRIVFTAQDV